MTRPFDPRALQFYSTREAPCPYLPDRLERKIFTYIDPLLDTDINDYLTHLGFRRSQNVMYRPTCQNCRECKSLRVCVQEFQPSKSQRRVISKNEDLRREIVSPFATEEQYDLILRYLEHRHPDGGMSDMDPIRFEMMIEESYSITHLAEYRNTDNQLIACAIIDKFSDGLSMVYSFFDPDYQHRSLGSFMILNHIYHTKDFDLAYLYLGYWVNNSPKMNYKTNFKPYEILGTRSWQRPYEQK